MGLAGAGKGHGQHFYQNLRCKHWIIALILVRHDVDSLVEPRPGRRPVQTFAGDRCVGARLLVSSAGCPLGYVILTRHQPSIREPQGGILQGDLGRHQLEGGGAKVQMSKCP